MRVEWGDQRTQSITFQDIYIYVHVQIDGLMERDRETSPKLNLCVCAAIRAPHTETCEAAISPTRSRLSLCRLVSFFSYVYSRRSILSLSPVLYQTAPAVDMLDNQPGGGLHQTI